MDRTERTQISDRLRSAIREASRRGIPQYRIAQAGPVHAVTLSDWMRGARDVALGDDRVIAIGQLLSIPADECFADTPRHHDQAAGRLA